MQYCDKKMDANNSIWFVLDTNVYLHYKWFEEIPWDDIAKTITGTENVNVGIGVPQKVLIELNEKKDSARGKIQKRAKKISSTLGDVFLKEKKTTFPILYIPNPRDCDFDDVDYHLSNNDDIILLSVKMWGNTSNAIIVSADNPMLIKAKNLGFNYYQINNQYALREELSEEEKEIKELKNKLLFYQNRLSSLKVLFKGNQDYIEFKKIENEDVEEKIKKYLIDLEKEYPIRHKKTHDDALYNSLYDQLYTEKSYEEYNKQREEFIQDSLYKKELELTAKRQEKTFKELSFFIDNSNGTAASGKTNIELYFPPDVVLYGKSRALQYYEPIEPKLDWGVNLSSLAYLTLNGRDKGEIKIWTDDDIIHKTTIPLEHNGINHHMTGFLTGKIWIDVSKCKSFTIEWQAVDAENPNVFSGKLNVIIK